MDDEDNTTPLVSKVEQNSSLEETIEECVGGFGWIQFLQVVIVSFVWIFDSQQTFISIFTDAQPTWHCLPGYSCNSNNICLLPENSWSWDMPLYTSIVSEWSLECASSLIIGLPTSSFYLGTLVGGFLLVALADSSFGRKNTILLSCIVMSISGLLTTLSTNIWIYSVLRFISGFGKATMGTCSLVLSSELVGKKYRGQTGTIGFFFFTLGFLSLPGIAYMNKGSSWRIIYLWTCTPALLYCLLVYFFVQESPRWLFIQGRKEDFLKSLRSIAPKKKGNIITLATISNISFEQKCGTVNMYSSLKMLLERKWAIQRLIAAMVVGFGIGLVYYGLPSVVENLNFNIYLSTVLNAMAEFPATLVTYFIIGKAKRRNAIFSLTTLCSICSLICVITGSSKWKGVEVVMELVSFFSVCTAFDVLLIYTLELFPTCIRNSGVTIVRQMMVAGGATSPVLMGRGKGLVSYLVFGLTIGICGVFVMCLPETRGETTCDTLDEEETKESRRAARVPDNDQPVIASLDCF